MVIFLPQAREGLLTPEAAAARLLWVRRGALFVTLIAWTTVVVGTFVVDPWFHQHVASSPLTLLEARPALAFWSDLVMEWKERISWTAALTASAGGFSSSTTAASSRGTGARVFSWRRCSSWRSAPHLREAPWGCC